MSRVAPRWMAISVRLEEVYTFSSSEEALKWIRAEPIREAHFVIVSGFSIDRKP